LCIHKMKWTILPHVVVERIQKNQG
jgi:hypothetical protein